MRRWGFGFLIAALGGLPANAYVPGIESLCLQCGGDCRPSCPETTLQTCDALYGPEWFGPEFPRIGDADEASPCSGDNLPGCNITGGGSSSYDYHLGTGDYEYAFPDEGFVLQFETQRVDRCTIVANHLGEVWCAQKQHGFCNRIVGLVPIEDLPNCGVGACERPPELNDFTGFFICDPGDPIAEICGNGTDDDCDGVDDTAEPGCVPPEICTNGVDDDFDTLVDCDDPDCQDLPTAETCGNDIDDNCDGFADWCDPVCASEEICGDDVDNDCDLDLLDDDDPQLCIRPNDRGAQAECAEKCDDRCAGKPVDLLTRNAFVGPHEDVRIVSPQGGNFDLVFSRTWESIHADRDNDDDNLSDPRDEQWPNPRILGAGWRHAYDKRLILEGDAGGGQPWSVMFVDGGKKERLFKIADDVFGNVPGRAIHATRLGVTWLVVDDDGSEYEFLEGAGAATEMHPWDTVVLPPELEPIADFANQRHARLRTIYPNGVSGYRVRVFHEQDTDTPTAACTGVDQLGDCLSTRGLLVAVAAEWISTNQTVWRRGSSLHFKYEAVPASAGTRTQYLLRRIVEGADTDESVPITSPTILSEYGYALGSHAWRQSLVDVASCVDRTDALGADNSGTSCIAQPGARLVTYVPGASAEAHLIAKVRRPAVSSAGAFILVDDEEFTWADDGDVFRVEAHKSAGVDLAIVLGTGEPDGEMSWELNGFTRKVTFDEGWPTRRERCDGATCVTLRKRAPQFETLDSGLIGKRAFGNRLSIPPGGHSMTLRKIDANGNVTHEIDLVPTAADEPTMTVDDASGVEVVVVDGSFTKILRATRNYYTGSPARLVAAATYTSTDIFNPNVSDLPSEPAERRFPTPAGAQALGWVALDVSVTARAAPANTTSLGGTAYYFDVDAFDADSGVVDPDTQLASNGLLNEDGERQVVWSHRVRTDATGGAVVRSSRSIVDIWGRTHWTFEYENTGGATADEHALSKSHNTFRGNASGTAARLRGQPLSSESFADATSPAAIVSWQACGAGSYDAHSKLTCRETPQTPLAMEVREITSTAPSGALRTIVKTKEGTAARLQTYQDHFPGGPVFESGPVGGNITKTSWSSTAGATSATMPTQTRQTDEAGTLLVLTATTYDAFGRATQQTVSDGSGVDQRDTSYAYQLDDSTIDLVTRAVTTSTSVVRDTDVDAVTGDVTQVIEEDGDVVENVYATSGVNRGRLMSVSRNNIEVQSFEYDLDGRVTAIWNGDEQAASYTYSEDGRLETETLHGVQIPSGGFINREYRDELVQIGGAGPYYRASRVTTRSSSNVIRDVRTISDHMGRTLRQCDLVSDPSCLVPIVEWIYDSKGAYVTGLPHVVEGTLRTVTLTNNNMNGRLAYVKHPAGAVFYEYDALGRITLMLTYEDTLPSSPAALDATKMRATELTYFKNTGEVDSVRYPSGRMVENKYGLNHSATQDRRGPAAVLIRVDPNGINNAHRILSHVSYDVDGAPQSWLWMKDGLVPQPKHTIERDMLGRVTRIRDLLDATVKTELQYTGHDGDGDVAAIVDNGPYGTILNGSLSASLPQTWSFGYGERDMLTAWTGFGGAHTLTLDDANGRRVSEDIAGTLHSYQYFGEWIEKRNASVANLDDLALYPSPTTRDATALDFGDDGSFEVASMDYSARGDLIAATTSLGTYNMRRDERMQRWTKFYPIAGQKQQFRYAPGGELIDIHETTTGFKRDEYVYLQGMPIGVVHTETSKPGPRTWLLSSDAMGTPRRALERDNVTFRQVSRLIMDAWGQARQTDDFAGIGWLPPHPALPSLPFRLPGQVADDELFTFENRWRTYLPDLGIYLQPDPDHRASASIYAGPQAYSYASGRPLVMSDPSGRFAYVCCDKNYVEVTVPITYLGRGEPAGWNNAVANKWSGWIGKYRVKTRVVDIGIGNFAWTLPGSAATVNGVAGVGDRGNFGYWGTSNSTDVIAHEVGHFLGLDDTHGSFPGSSPSWPDIMGLGIWAGPNENQIAQVLRNARLPTDGAGCDCNAIGQSLDPRNIPYEYARAQADAANPSLP